MLTTIARFAPKPHDCPPAVHARTTSATPGFRGATRTEETTVQDASQNPALNGVRLPDGRVVSWAEAFPRDYATIFRKTTATG